MRILFIYLVISLLPISAVAQLQMPACQTGSVFHNCFGVILSNKDTKYVGEFRDDRFHGQGTYTYADGTKYVGEFKDGNFHGKGTLTLFNGTKYLGEFRDDRFHGQGTYTYADGTKYVGEFKDGNPTQGILTLSNGSEYVGEFKDGNFHGKGTFTLFDGNKYVGEFRDDRFHGQGTYTYSNGTKYVGEFKDNQPHGPGTKIYANGSKYVGAFKDGKQNGRGTHTWKNGDKYVGEFKDDELNGQGTYFFTNGDKDEGEFKSGKLNGRGAKIYANGSKFVGEFKDDKQNGQGIKYDSSGAVELQGHWENGNFVQAERRVALVLGNADYKNAPLANPVNDAVDISATLKGLGFQVTTVQNANLRKMREATRGFESSVASADVALIFYAGHAVEAKGKNFVIPVDADVAREYELEDQAYDAQQWLAMLGDTKGRNTQRVNIVILDACRDNPVSRQWRSSISGLGRMDAPSGTLLVYSTSPGKVASDGPKGQRNSPFTKSLLRSIQTPNLPVEQVLKDVRRKVMAETKGEQIPWENSSLIGDFVFKRQP